MANAGLTITATWVNGGGTKDAELEQLKRACDLAIAMARGNGANVTSGSVNSPNDVNATATWTYTPVATKQ